MSALPRPIILAIDVEPDARQQQGDSFGGRGSQDSLRQFEVLRERLEAVTGRAVQFNWFFRFDPQIAKIWGRPTWIADAFPDLLEMVSDRRDYIGIHLHLWRWNPTRQHWFSDLSDPAWLDECLRTSIETFQQVFGHRPEALRFGDRWLNQQAVDQMQALGIRYDLTIEPGYPHEPIFDDPWATAPLPDYRHAPRAPYRPARGDYLRPSLAAENGTGLWMLPLTTSHASWRLTRRAPYIVKAVQSANLSLNSSRVSSLLAARLGEPAATPLVMVMRSGDLASPRYRANFLRTTARLEKHSAMASCWFTNPATAIAGIGNRD